MEESKSIVVHVDRLGTSLRRPEVNRDIFGTEKPRFSKKNQSPKQSELRLNDMIEESREGEEIPPIKLREVKMKVGTEKNREKQIQPKRISGILNGHQKRDIYGVR
jgi:hypothetical protein